MSGELSQEPPLAKRGLFEEAEGGTLFLDEVGNLNLSMPIEAF